MLAVVAFVAVMADSDLEDDAQTEFFLPVSETEDVDFHIARPEGFGCYLW